MSISLAVINEILIALFLGAIAVGGMGLAGTFRKQTILGPPRITGEMGFWMFTLITGIGAATWLGAQIVYGVMLAIRSGGKPISADSLGPEDYAFLSTVPPIVAFAILFAADRFIRGDMLARIGFTVQKILPGIARGALASLIILPLMFFSSLLLEGIYHVVGFEHPSSHDLLRAITEAGPVAKVAMIIGATVAAPLFEELFFRGHIQTILVRLISPHDPPVVESPLPPAIAGSATDAPPIDAPLPSPVLQYQPTPPPLPVLEYLPPPPRREPTPRRAWIAVILTSFLFAIVHPLWTFPLIFILALAIGYVYERTGNLWACITIHAIFNGVQTVVFLQFLK